MDRRKMVLVLDFDADLLIALEALLEDCGFSCTSTWNIDQACAWMESGTFDFMVLGNRPPELNAQEILADLRSAGLRFGSFILGNLDHQDGFGNLLDQLRRFPCEQRLEKKKSNSAQELLECSEWVRHGS